MFIACKIGRDTTPVGSHGNSFQDAHGGLIQYNSLSLIMFLMCQNLVMISDTRWGNKCDNFEQT